MIPLMGTSQNEPLIIRKPRLLPNLLSKRLIHQLVKLLLAKLSGFAMHPLETLTGDQPRVTGGNGSWRLCAMLRGTISRAHRDFPLRPDSASFIHSAPVECLLTNCCQVLSML